MTEHSSPPRATISDMRDLVIDLLAQTQTVHGFTAGETWIRLTPASVATLEALRRLLTALVPFRDKIAAMLRGDRR